MSDSLALQLTPDVIAAARGDHRAFARLVDTTRNTVTAITLAILRDIELSSDVAQEVYLMVWRDLAKLRDPASFLPWLRQMTRNRAHQALRTHVRSKRRFEADADAVFAAAADPRPAALQGILDEEDRNALANAISDLPDASREVVILFYREGQSTAQVASLLDLSEDAVRQRLTRARKQLRAMLIPAIEATRPDARFTAAVLVGIASLSLPATASAAVVGLGKTGKASSMLSGFIGAGATAALAGLAGGWAGVFFGTRGLLRLARDEEERRGVIGVGGLCAAVTFAFAVGILIEPTPLVATIGFFVMMGGYWIAHFVWLPRVTRRRVEAELREDPVAAASLHRDRRRHARLGYLVGTFFGGAAVLASWFF